LRCGASSGAELLECGPMENLVVVLVLVVVGVEIIIIVAADGTRS
jgi:hypothetical protein